MTTASRGNGPRVTHLALHVAKLSVEEIDNRSYFTLKSLSSMFIP